MVMYRQFLLRQLKVSRKLGFDLTEVMKANTYDAKTTKNVNFTGLPEEMSAAAKEPETYGKTE